MQAHARFFNAKTTIYTGLDQLARDLHIVVVDAGLAWLGLKLDTNTTLQVQAEYCRERIVDAVKGLTTVDMGPEDDK
ncbi:hypothetical protein KDH_40370 [Dictyobacter sp. S3.2.2.5]|uniref:Uncharacterized protein n=1 Tax=Dictyobacter halimunensis TaxID=3026934 RepID=A0ABQ6FSG7_9CHLR|nr:hypothetical protein KDH_40370 [Dictyobacter sp. S3.2.2.5]